MKRYALTLCVLLAASSFCSIAQSQTPQMSSSRPMIRMYPFNDTSLGAEERIDNLLSLMTLDEKIATFTGMGVPRLGVASAGSTEAIHGVVSGGATTLPPLGGSRDERRSGNPLIYNTAFPQGYGLGETWDRGLLRDIGEAMTIEAQYASALSGFNRLILWAPNADLARDPRWGRTEECFGEDPFLAGELVAAEVRGIQGDDPEHWRGAALMKHFLANSNEDGRDHTDSRFDEALFRDYYSYAFWKGVKDGGARSLMCAYNKYNGVPCSANDFIQDILIDEWGMDGPIINDGSALSLLVNSHHYAEDMKHGAAICIEAGITRFLDNVYVAIHEALEEGLITEELINRNVRFNLRTMLRLGLLDPPETPEIPDTAPWETEKHKALALKAAQESVVLLKNDGGLLPLDRSKVSKIAVFGNRAEEVLKDWYGALPTYTVSPLDGIRKAAPDAEVRFQTWDYDGSAQELARWADVAIVCVGNHPVTSPDWGQQSVQSPWGYGLVAGDGREAVDRRSLQLETEDLIKVVSQANPHTVVALISSFPFAINWTQEHVPSILHMTQCGQETGTALAQAIFGDINPAGRTTQTWVRDILDLPNMLDYDIRNGRTYMYFGGKPLYAFGHGLSYSSFKYSRLSLKKGDGGALTVTFNVKNVSGRDGEEVPQVYVKFPGDDAAMRLRGFDRISVAAGQTRRVEIVIAADDLKLWDTPSHSFTSRKGAHRILVGASSADIRLKKRVRR